MWYCIRMAVVIGVLAFICYAYISEVGPNNKGDKKDKDKNDST